LTMSTPKPLSSSGYLDHTPLVSILAAAPIPA